MQYPAHVLAEAERLRAVHKMDAGEALFFARELEHVKSQLYDTKYPELRARMFIPVDNSAGPGAESITYYQFDKVGMAKVISDYADDLPRADALGRKFTSPVESLGNSYGYSLQEVRASQMAGRNLPTQKAMAARRAHEQLVDQIAATGHAATGLKGMLNHANVPAGDVADNAGGTSKLWEDKTADEILADLNEPVEEMIDSTHGVETPDTLLLPPRKLAHISHKRVGDTGETVLSFFLRTNAWIRNVDHWHRLTGAGVGGTDRMVVYRRSPDVLTLEIPQDFEQLEVQRENLAFTVPCHSRIGGVIIYRPLALIYRDGF